MLDKNFGRLDTLFNLLDKSELSKFLENSYKSGGFASNPGSAPNIMHTRMALDVIDMCSLEPPKMLPEILSFVESCKNPAGYGFCPGGKPNIYATRNALEVILKLGNAGEEEAVHEAGWQVRNLISTLVDAYSGSSIGVMSGYQKDFIHKRINGIIRLVRGSKATYL